MAVVVISLQFTDLRAQLMTVPPFAAAYVVTLLVSWSADHFNAYVLLLARKLLILIVE